MPNSILVKRDDDFSAHYSENTKHFVLSDHHHNHLEIIYIKEGRIELTVNDRKYTAGAGAVVLLNNMEPHQLTILEYPYRRHVLMFKQSFLSMFTNEPVLASVFQHRPKNFKHCIQLPPEQEPLVSGIFLRIHDEYREARPYWEKSVKMLLCQLVIELYRISEKSFPLSNLNQSVYKTVLVDIQNYLDEHFMEEINLKDMAAMFHTNMYYLCHLFKEVTGITFKNHLIQRRVSYAKDLLSYTGKDISEIAAETGFSSVNHFIRTFKKLVAITPYQYRKSFRKSHGIGSKQAASSKQYSASELEQGAGAIHES